MPSPFYHFPDPNPHFVGSMFCIEQYALAMALAQYLGDYNLGDGAVMLFERELILLQHDGRMSFDVVTKIPAHLADTSTLSVGTLSGVSFLSPLSGAVSGLSNLRLSGLRLSGIHLSGLTSFSSINLSSFNSLGLKISGLNVSGLNVSGVNTSGINLSGINLSGINLSGINLSGINLSGLTTEALLEHLNMSGLNLSGVNLSGLTLSELERFLVGGSVDLSGVDLKYLQGSVDTSSPIYSNLTLVDKFGNSFIHYYHQNFEPLKEGTIQGGQFSELFNDQAKKL